MDFIIIIVFMSTVSCQLIVLLWSSKQHVRCVICCFDAVCCFWHFHYSSPLQWYQYLFKAPLTDVCVHFRNNNINMSPDMLKLWSDSCLFPHAAATGSFMCSHVQVQYSLSFSSVFGLHFLLREISVCSTMFTSCSMTMSVCYEQLL